MAADEWGMRSARSSGRDSETERLGEQRAEQDRENERQGNVAVADKPDEPKARAKPQAKDSKPRSTRVAEPKLATRNERTGDISIPKRDEDDWSAITGDVRDREVEMLARHSFENGETHPDLPGNIHAIGGEPSYSRVLCGTPDTYTELCQTHYCSVKGCNHPLSREQELSGAKGTVCNHHFMEKVATGRYT